LDPEETHTTNKQTNKQMVLQTWEKTNPAVSQKPPERNPKFPDDTGEKKIIIIAVVAVIVMRVMVVEPRKRRAPNVRDMIIMSGRSLTESRADTILFRVARRCGG
jgi:hypothetical protein